MPLFKCSASKAKPKNGIAYVTDEKKAKIVSVRNLFEDEDYAKQFDETASRFGKGDKFDERKYYHCKLSCARQDNVSPEKAHAYAEELTAKLFQNYECVIATHTDTQTVHSHIIVNAVDPITGKKLQFNKQEYSQAFVYLWTALILKCFHMLFPFLKTVKTDDPSCHRI